MAGAGKSARDAPRRGGEERRHELHLGGGLGLALGQRGDAGARLVEGELAWGSRLTVTRYFAGGHVCWQPFSEQLARADMVVMTAENKLLYNLYVQLFERRARVALWGHGANLQGDPNSLRERFKRRVALRADWWLAYTEYSRPLILQCGFPQDRITVLNNAVDTRDMAAMRRYLGAMLLHTNPRPDRNSRPSTMS